MHILIIEDDLNGKIEYKKYIIAQNEILQFPICIYRFNETEYMALLME